MDEFRHARHFRYACEAFLQPVLHRLHVVVGGALDGFDALGIGRCEASSNGRKKRASRFRERRDFNDGGLLTQRLEPPQLDLDSAANEAVFAEAVRQRRYLGAVASVQRTKSGESSQRVGHERIDFITTLHDSMPPALLTYDDAIIAAHGRAVASALSFRFPPGHEDHRLIDQSLRAESAYHAGRKEDRL